MKKITNRNWSTECKSCVLMVNPLQGQDYINEAEHMDGEEYWMQFETVSEVLKDLQLYTTFMPKAEIRAAAHKYLDIMVDHLNFVEGDQVMEMFELRLAGNGKEEFVAVSKDFLTDGKVGTFSEVFIQYSTSYGFNHTTQVKTLTEQDTMYYHNDGSEYTQEELDDCKIIMALPRVWTSTSI